MTFPKPHDTIEMEGRFWVVTGDFMGGLSGESVAEALAPPPSSAGEA
jgi:hypothetical protein